VDPLALALVAILVRERARGGHTAASTLAALRRSHRAPKRAVRLGLAQLSR
jgi:hypothetical protein